MTTHRSKIKWQERKIGNNVIIRTKNEKSPKGENKKQKDTETSSYNQQFHDKT